MSESIITAPPIIIHAAQAVPVSESERKPPVHLKIERCETLENSDAVLHTLEDVAAYHESNALHVCRALKALPQGTRHRVLINLLKEHECFLRI